MKRFSTIASDIGGHMQKAYCQFRDARLQNRHVLVIESDDWGSDRIPSKEIWNKLMSLGYGLDKRPYECYDTLESCEDVVALFDVLSRYTDIKGNHPVVTANFLTSNPNYEKIRQDNGHQYYRESILDTYSRKSPSVGIMNVFHEGIDAGVFYPQCHGREHLNVSQWMDDLRNENKEAIISLEHGIPGIFPKENPSAGNKCVIALSSRNEHEEVAVCEIVQQALCEFKQIWGFESRTFVAPNYTWNNRIEHMLAEGGVRLIQTARMQKSPQRSTPICHYSGQISPYGLIYSVRNCTFEPSTIEDDREVKKVLDSISKAFSKNKIAIISSHRINYVGGIDKKRRNNNLSLLNYLLRDVIERYPDVEFLNSEQLISLL